MVHCWRAAGNPGSGTAGQRSDDVAHDNYKSLRSLGCRVFGMGQLAGRGKCFCRR